MVQCASNVICMEELNGGYEEDVTVVTYKIADDFRGYSTEVENAETKSNLHTQHTGRETTRNRCCTVTAVCLLVLCVLLLTAVTMLGIKFNQLQREREVLQTLSKQGWTYFSSSFYDISTEKKSWTESRHECRQKGADLVIINSKEEQEFISKLQSDKKAWIGLNDRDSEDVWKWVDRTPMTTGYWGSGEPNSYREEENCVLTHDGYWADYSCKLEFNWICEKPVFD